MLSNEISGPLSIIRDTISLQHFVRFFDFFSDIGQVVMLLSIGLTSSSWYQQVLHDHNSTPGVDTALLAPSFSIDTCEPDGNKS